MADRNGYIGRAPGDSSVTVARQTFSPTGVTTDFTFASGYVAGYYDIFINGVKMIEGSDYTSTDGSTFSVLNGGATSGDVIEGVAYKAFNAATATVGIYSGGDPISTQANILNFVGTGNTFALRGSTVDISISGGGVGAGGTFAVNSTGIHTTKSVGIGTTTATGAADTNNTAVLNVGIVTANSLFGALTGDVTGTATGLSGSPNITINNLTGVAATFTGVLTYEDVTNVDSVGIITARSHVSIADSILHTGDTDTSIRFPAANTFTVETGGGEALRVDSSQRLLIGATSDSNLIRHGQAFAVATTDQFGGGSFSGFNGTRSNEGPIIDLQRSRATSKTPGTVVVDDDRLGSLVFRGDDGTDFADAAFMLGEVDGTPGSGFVPGRLTFHTGTTSAVPTERLRITSVGEVRVGSAFSVGQAGIVTAAEFHGDGSNLTNLPAAAGITTQVGTGSGIVTSVFLSDAVDHKITATGFCTITSTQAGTEGESHTIRIVNSGIATVGFSTYFLFPSGSAPSMPTADGAVSLISFTVHDSVGAGCTQLLAGASVNFS